MLLSVIVPVYNAEKYIEECVDSLLKQNVNKEIILVDDGSTDSSGVICDRLANQYEEIRVYHKKQAGCVAARNDGFSVSNGDFITFVDSDDYLGDDFFAVLMPYFLKYANVDIVVGGMVKASNGDNLYEIGEVFGNFLLNREQAIYEMVSFRMFHWELCGKIYRRHLLAGCKMDINIKWYEDLYANWQLFEKARCVLFDSNVHYCYRMNPNSVTSSQEHILSDGGIEVFSKVCAYMWPNIKEVHRIMQRKYAALIIEYLRGYFFSNKQKRRIEVEYLLEKAKSVDICVLDEAYGYKDMYCKVTSDYKSCENFFETLLYRIKTVMSDMGNKGFYLYGTGIMGKCLYDISRQLNLECHGWIVSDGYPKYDVFFSKKVYYLSEYSNLEVKFPVLLAVNSSIARKIIPFIRMQEISVYHIDTGIAFY